MQKLFNLLRVEQWDRYLAIISEIKIKMNEMIKGKSQAESTTDNHENNSERKKKSCFPGLLPFKLSSRIFQ